MRYQSYVFVKKEQQFTQQNTHYRRVRMTHTVHLLRHDVLTVP